MPRPDTLDGDMYVKKKLKTCAWLKTARITTVLKSGDKPVTDKRLDQDEEYPEGGGCKCVWHRTSLY